MWSGGKCSHKNAATSVYGLVATLFCEDCKAGLNFTLRFGRPKTFSVSVQGGSFMGFAPVADVSEFIMSRTSRIMMPDGGADPEGGQPNRDGMMLTKLMEALMGEDIPDVPKKDFERAWKRIGCDHKTISCQLYGNMISLECRDCATGLLFRHMGKGRFYTEMKRMPLEEEEYGMHDIRTVIGIMRDYVKELEIPGMMADKMSDDPERDAQNLAAIIKVLEKFGVLRRVEATNRNPKEDRMAKALSALTHSRKEFVGVIKKLSKMKHNLKFDDGKVSVRYGLESCRLAWPCWFESDCFDIDAYEPVGIIQFCAKCGHSTLDDDMEPSYWKNGCRECGYRGLLVGLGLSKA